MSAACNSTNKNAGHLHVYSSFAFQSRNTSKLSKHLTQADQTAPFYNVSWGNHHQRNGYLLWKPFVGHLSAIFIHLDTKNTRTTCMLMARGDKVTVHCNSETVTPAFENWQLKLSIKEKLKTTGWRKTEEVGQKFNCFLHMIHEDSRVRAARADHVVCTVWPQASVSAGALV